MLDFLKIENVPFVLFFIVPGLIISFIRTRFIKNRAPTNSEAILYYFTISMIYHALLLPLFFIIFPDIVELASMEELFQWIRTNKRDVIFIFAIFVLTIPGILGLLLRIEYTRRMDLYFIEAL